MSCCHCLWHARCCRTRTSSMQRNEEAQTPRLPGSQGGTFLAGRPQTPPLEDLGSAEGAAGVRTRHRTGAVAGRRSYHDDDEMLDRSPVQPPTETLGPATPFPTIGARLSSLSGTYKTKRVLRVSDQSPFAVSVTTKGFDEKQATVDRFMIKLLARRRRLRKGAALFHIGDMTSRLFFTSTT